MLNKNLLYVFFLYIKHLPVCKPIILVDYDSNQTEKSNFGKNIFNNMFMNRFDGHYNV